MTMLNTPDQISWYRILTLRAGLRLEVLGIKRSRAPSFYASVKFEFGFRGNKQKVLDQLNAYIDANRAESAQQLAKDMT